MNIQLAIDEIVLEGFELPPGGRARFEESLSAELTTLLLSSPSARFSAGYALADVPAPVFRTPLSSHPVELGRQLAATLHGTLTGGTDGAGPR